MNRLTAPQARVVGEAWAFRVGVERDATVHFTRIAAGLSAVGAPPRLLEVARRAAEEEARHAALCASLAEDFGASVPAHRREPRPLAPARFTGLAALAYEVVAHCCVAETESVATLTSLIGQAGPAKVKDAVVSIARDEVEHAQLGWAFLSWARGQLDPQHLGRQLPAMLAPGAAALFQASPPHADDEALVRYGVLPHGARRETFLAVLDDVLLPGLAQVGIDGASARAWVDAQRGSAS